VVRRRVIQAHWLSTIFVLLSILLISACGGSGESTPTSVPVDEGNSEAGSPSSSATKIPESTQTTPTNEPTRDGTPRSGSDSGTLSLNDALDGSIELYVRLLDVLAGVTDEATAQAAVRELSDILREFQALGSQLEDYSDAEIASAVLSSRFYDLGQQFSGEVTRIMLNPATARVLAAAFSELEGTGSSREDSGLTSTPPPSLIPGGDSIPIGEVESLNLALRLSFSSLPSFYQECFRDGFNSLGLDLEGWQRGEFDVTLEQYNESLLVCALAR